MGDFLYSIATADLNGDNLQDIAVVSYYPYDLSILIGAGDGTFEMAERYYTGKEPLYIAIDDLNSDTYQDLVTVNMKDYDISVFEGLGDGTFLSPVYYYPSHSPKTIVISDIDDDARKDIIVTCARENVTIIKNNICYSGCQIEGICYKNKTLNYENPCKICDTTKSNIGWSDNDGINCESDGLYCNGYEYCQNGICSGHSGDPCNYPEICDETLGGCKMPTDDDDDDNEDDDEASDDDNDDNDDDDDDKCGGCS